MAMVFSMLVGILGDLILLPALLRQFPDLLNKRRTIADRKVRSEVASAAVCVAVILSGADISFAATPQTLSGNESIETFAKELAKKIFARDEKVEVTLTNVEPDGESEERKVELSRLAVKINGKTNQKVVARIVEPKSLRGSAVLTVTDGSSVKRWIYLPSSKQVRRVVGGDENAAPILGSELSTEDLDLSQVDGAKARIVSRENGIVTIESTISNKESAYSKCTARFDATTRLLKAAECQDRKGQPYKRITVAGYRRLSGGVERPTEMKIENVKTKRFTKIVFSEQKVNSGLSPSGFTPESLSD